VPKAVEFSASELAERLLNVSIFESLSQRQLRKLSKSTKVLAFEEGEMIVKRGEEGNALYLIVEGAAEVRRGSRKLARLTIGQFFGEMSIFDNQARSADVVAVRPSKVAILSRWEFWRFADTEPTVLRNVLGEMARRLRQTDLTLSE
jgi:CRP-like cAMP-binding protein